MEFVLLSFLAVICSLLQQGVGLSCYECNSHHNESCWDKPPDSVIRECKYDNPVCRIIYIDVKTEIGGMSPHSRVVRTCGEMDERDETRPCYRISEYGVNQHICSCRGEACNSSGTPAATTSLILLTFTLMFF